MGPLLTNRTIRRVKDSTIEHNYTDVWWQLFLLLLKCVIFYVYFEKMHCKADQSMQLILSILKISSISSAHSNSKVYINEMALIVFIFLYIEHLIIDFQHIYRNVLILFLNFRLSTFHNLCCNVKFPVFDGSD